VGDRASVIFKKGDEESPVLCSHWGGKSFQMEADRYASELIRETEGKHFNPIDRLEPGTVMVDFIRHITKGMDRVQSDLYLGKDRHEVDDSDNGCWYVNLPEK
jgi:hypothetical protein